MIDSSSFSLKKRMHVPSISLHRIAYRCRIPVTDKTLTALPARCRYPGPAFSLGRERNRILSRLRTAVTFMPHPGVSAGGHHAAPPRRLSSPRPGRLCCEKHPCTPYPLYGRLHPPRPTRLTLRRAVRDLKRAHNANGFTLLPRQKPARENRTGGDCMGLWFTKRGIRSIALRAFSKHRLPYRRFYEPIRHLKPHLQDERMALYRRRFFSAIRPSVFFPYYICVACLGQYALVKVDDAQMHEI